MESWGYHAGIGTIRDMIEQAQEELQILEAEHPNRFSYLKVELKSFISHLESQSLLLPATKHHVPNCINEVVDPLMGSRSLHVASSVSTQESSAGQKWKKVRLNNGTALESKNANKLQEQKAQKIYSIKNRDGGGSKRKERIDAVIDTARACLHKIQQLKTSFG